MLTSRGARFPAALRRVYTAIALPLRPAARPAMPAPCTVLAGPLRLTFLRSDFVMRAGLLVRRAGAAPRSLSTARARLLLRRRRFMPLVYPRAHAATSPSGRHARGDWPRQLDALDRAGFTGGHSSRISAAAGAGPRATRSRATPPRCGVASAEPVTSARATAAA